MTYAGLAVLFLLGCLLVAAMCLLLVRPSARWILGVVLVALVLMVLTAVFDSVMIAADLFRFDEEALAGARVGLAPVEDFAWPLAAALLLPALWQALGRRRSRARQANVAGDRVAPGTPGATHTPREPGRGGERP